MNLHWTGHSSHQVALQIKYTSSSYNNYDIIILTPPPPASRTISAFFRSGCVNQNGRKQDSMHDRIIQDEYYNSIQPEAGLEPTGLRGVGEGELPRMLLSTLLSTSLGGGLPK